MVKKKPKIVNDPTKVYKVRNVVTNEGLAFGARWTPKGDVFRDRDQLEKVLAQPLSEYRKKVREGDLAGAAKAAEHHHPMWALKNWVIEEYTITLTDTTKVITTREDKIDRLLNDDEACPDQVPRWKR